MNSKNLLNLELIKVTLESIINSSNEYVVELGLYLNGITNLNIIKDFSVKLKDVDIKRSIREYKINHLLEKNEEKTLESFDKIIGEKFLKNPVPHPLEQITISLIFPEEVEIISLNITKIT